MAVPDDQSRPSPEEMHRFREALCGAFPTPKSLEQMVAFGLGPNLDEVVAPGKLRERISELILWSVTNERFDDLVRVSWQDNPDHPKLQEFYKYWSKRRPPTPTGQRGGDKEGLGRLRAWLALHRGFGRIAVYLSIIRGLVVPHDFGGQLLAAGLDDQLLQELEEFWTHEASLLISDRIGDRPRTSTDREFFSHRQVRHLVSRLAAATDAMDGILDAAPEPEDLLPRMGELTETLCRLEQSCAALLDQSGCCLSTMMDEVETSPGPRP